MVRDEPSDPPPPSLADLRRSNDELERRVAALLARPESAEVGEREVGAHEAEPASAADEAEEPPPAG
jgi:hypothetical protein